MAVSSELPTIAELCEAAGRGQRALVIDSGVETTHPDLAGRSIASLRVRVRGARAIVTSEADADPGREPENGGLGPGETVSDPEASTDKCNPEESADKGDPIGHGTAVASILARHAPAARLDSLRVLDGSALARSDHIIAAIEHGIDAGYGVVNCSFTTARSDLVAEYKRVIDRAFCRGVLVVSAGSNDSYSRPEYPSAFPSVIATRAARLPGLAIRRRSGSLVEFLANGEDVPVAWRDGGRRVASGTSMAAPHLAALVLRIKELRPDWNACEMIAALYRIADRPDYQQALASQRGAPSDSIGKT